MAQAPYLSTQKQYKGKYIVKDLFTKNMSSKSTGDDLFSMVETSPNGRDGIFDTREEALETIEERNKPTWLPPQPFLNIGVKARLIYERLRARSEI